MTIQVEHSEIGSIRLNEKSIIFIRHQKSDDPNAVNDLEIRTNHGIFFCKKDQLQLDKFIMITPVANGGFPRNFADNHDIYINPDMVVCIYDLESTKEDPIILIDYDKWAIEIYSDFYTFYNLVSEKINGMLHGVSLNESLNKITDIRQHTAFNVCYNDSYLSYITPAPNSENGSTIEFLPTSKIKTRLFVKENIWRDSAV